MNTRQLATGNGAISRILLKLLLTLFTGGITYLLTNTFDQPRIMGLTLSAFVGGVTLVVQFLVEFDDRLQHFEAAQTGHAAKMEKTVGEGFSKINEVTELFGLVEASALRTDVVIQLVRHSTQISSGTPTLIHDFAQSEISRISEFLKELSEGADVTYDGEDRDWLLGLARNVQSSIDATSLTTVDAGGKGFVDGGLWVSDLGQRYLEIQRDAVQRGVTIRRVFILDRPELAGDSDLRRVCKLHQDVGITLRVLDPSAIPGTRKSSLFDFILFDNVVSYEVTPASRIEDGMRPVVVNTRLVLRETRVRERIQRFKDLWISAHDFD